MSYTTLASDALVLAAGAAAVTVVALTAKNAPFKTSLGTDGDDDSLCAPEEPSSSSTTTTTTAKKQQSKQTMKKKTAERVKLVDDEKVATVTVSEVPLTPPPVAEMHGDQIFNTSTTKTTAK